MKQLISNLRKSSEQCNLQIGEKVKMVNCAEAAKYNDRIWIVASQPFDICGTVCVKLEDFKGGFDANCLKRVEEKSNA